ncbi:flagellar biosynthetic protein FliR [Rhodobium orientis]|nr:flagellar biosynthetic protein FliR [Rhodobium orientis]MBB4301807.1 flagellar biosynthetic protein FliR [Rhodobium orientis]
MTITLLPSIAAIFMLMFARFGTMLMLMPALGETSISMQARLGFAVLLTLVMYPAAAPLYPVGVDITIPRLIALGGGEMLVGFTIGLSTRLLLSVATVAGTTIASQSGLAFAQAVDPAQGIQGALFANFIGLLGTTLIFATDLHHVAIAGVHDSLTLFPPGTIPPVGDAAQMVLMVITSSFEVALQISAPFLVFGLVFYFGLGLLNRLMPQIQIFFIAMPANILMGLILMFLLIGAIMTAYVGHIEAGLTRFLVQ